MNDRIHELIVKELQGKATAQDQGELRLWLIESKQNEEIYKNIKEAWLATDAYQPKLKVDVNAAWKNIENVIGGKEETKVVSMFNRVLAVAASIALLLSVGFLITKFTGKPVQMATVTTGSESKKIHLADGTDVWLNQNSSFTYPEKFGDTRNVSLSGEAFFEVAKDAAHPFIITAGNTHTQVWGTSFNVRAYSAEKDIEVSVATGKVSFGDTADLQHVFLLPGDMGSFDKSVQNLNKTKTGNNFLAWKTGELQFDHLPVKDVVKDMERYYHVRLALGDSSLTQVSFSGKLSRQPLTDAVKILESSLGVRIVRDSATAYSIYSN